MKKSRFSDSQILSILKQAENGVPVPELCREHGMSSASFYKWLAITGDVQWLQDLTVQGFLRKPCHSVGGIHFVYAIAERCGWLGIHAAFQNFLKKTLTAGAINAKIGRAHV